MWRAGRHVQRYDVTTTPVPYRSSPPPPNGCGGGSRRRQYDPLGQGSAFGDPTSSIASIVLSLSESNGVALFFQWIFVVGPGEAGLGSLVDY